MKRGDGSIPVFLSSVIIEFSFKIMGPNQWKYCGLLIGYGNVTEMDINTYNRGNQLWTKRQNT